MKHRFTLAGILFLAAFTAVTRAYDFIDEIPAWPAGNVILELQLGSTPIYGDGTTPNGTAIQAISAWNPYMKRVQFTYVNNSGAAKSKTNGKNNVFFNGNVYGTAFGSGVLAVTVGRANSSGPIEMDVVVNSARQWDSYRGYLRYDKMDLRRVLAHEFGHVLGLDHPDEAGQWVNALMNSHVSDIDTTVTDDQDGVGARYGRGTANPAVAPTINYQPSSVTVTEGWDAQFFATAEGTNPIAYQWTKDGVDIPNATESYFVLRSVRVADAGKYALKATNEAGTTTSNEATLTVNAATVPVFSSHPQNSTVEVGGTISMHASASSNSVIRLQWTRDGVNIPNATDWWLSIYDAKATDAGEYRLLATTIAGTATSNAAVVTMIPANPPVITSHPASGSAVVGNSFSFYAYATSSIPVTYQWMRNGAAIPNATYHNLYLYNLTAADAGTYELVATNAAGSVSSNAATLVINPLPPPQVLMLNNTSVMAGETLHLWSWGSDSGSNTYQWYHNGVPIAGATGSSYAVSNVTSAHAGEYLVVATNPAGSTTGHTAIVTVRGASPVSYGGWREAVTDGGIVYFLFENPSRIERFDLATEKWLTALTLSRAARTMTISGPGKAVVAFYRNLAQIDLTTGAESALLSTDTDPTELAVHNGRLYILATSTGYSTGRIGSVDLANPAGPVWSHDSYYLATGLSIDRTHGKAFTSSTGVSPGNIAATVLNTDGTFGGTTNSPYHGQYVIGTESWVNPSDTMVIDNSGMVYSTADLTAVGSVGTGLDALAFTPTGSIFVAQGKTVAEYNENLIETGRLTLTRDANLLVYHGESIFAFTQPSGAGTTISWERNPISNIGAPKPLAAVSPATLDYSADGLVLDRDGTLLILSRLHGNIFRWSASEQRYLAPIPLMGRPNHIAYSSDLHRLYVAYADGRIRYIDLELGTTESTLVTAPGRIISICMAADYLVLASLGNSSWPNYSIYDVDGTRTATTQLYSESRDMVWNADRSRFYQISNYGIRYTEITAGGKFGTSKESSYSSSAAATLPLRISPYGDVLLAGTGRFFNADTLTQNNELPHGLQDATWVGNRLFTVRDTLTGAEIKRWGGTNYAQDAVCLLGGRSLRLFALSSDRLVAVTQKGKRLAFTLLDADLVVQNHFEKAPDLTRVVLANLSTRAEVGTGDNVVIAGFVVSGSGDKRVLLRAVGPGLDRFGVSGTLDDPVLSLVGDDGEIATNDDWSSSDVESLKSAFKEVFAFSIPEDSLDAALVTTLRPGKYTALVSGKNGTQGVALVEAYDLDADPGERRLINISTRAVVGIGDKVLIPGIVVEGTESKRLLIRAAGPALARFGVAGVLADPRLEVINDDDILIAANDNWGDDNTEVTQAATTAASAFRLADGSRDAALVATLPPGSYTVVVRGVGDTTGVALVEVYEVP